MAIIGLVVHEFRDAASHAARTLIDDLASKGHEIWIPADTDRQGPTRAGADRLDGDQFRSGPVAFVPPGEFGTDVDLMISLGGDGSMLRAVNLVADFSVPVMGANFGQLGYLTEFEPDAVSVGVDRFLGGDAQVEERMRVSTILRRKSGEAIELGNGLNEAIVEKVESGRTVRLDVSIDGEFFTRYSADGVIVATPTGSTAYSLSARGPIVAPAYETLIVTAVAPHMLFDRSLILDPRSEVKVSVVDDRPASLSIDGRLCGRVEPGDEVVCTRSAIPARIVVGADRSFLGVLKAKFGLDDRLER